MYTVEQKNIMLAIARDAIQKKLGIEPEKKIERFAELEEKRAVFVTLKKNGLLRGCIGHLQAICSLEECINEMACSAAFSDPRFPPVQQNELHDITIEISVLSPTTLIDSINKIKMGVHGVILKKGLRRSVFLPQVAEETGWSREIFLEQLALKAGLSPHEYKDAEYSVFTVCKFSEITEV